MPYTFSVLIGSIELHCICNHLCYQKSLWSLCQQSNDPFRCAAVPPFRNVSPLPLSGKKFVQSRLNRIRICPDKLIGTYCTSFRALGIIPKRNTGNMHHRCLFCNPSGIGNDSFTIPHKIIELQITKRFYYMQ